MKRKPLGKQFRSIDIKEYQFDKENRTISGYAAIFDNVDKAGDMLIRGCFSRSLKERGPESSANDKIIFLWMHKMDEPLGKITKLIEDERGLYFEATIDRIDLGDRALIQLESGTLNQFSIGYNYVWDRCEWRKVNGIDVFVVGEVVLYEISVVSIGCNGETEYGGLKSSEDVDKAYNELFDNLSNELKDLPINKKSALQGLISKVWSLAKIETATDRKGSQKPLDEKHDNGFFAGIKFNN